MVIGAAAEQIPFVKNFSSSDYKSGLNNWCIAQDRNSFIYVGNGGGAILVFDGNEWRSRYNRNGSTPRSMALGADGKIYVGCQGEIGVIEKSADTLHYTSLEHLIPQNHRKFYDVWKTYALGDSVLFQAYNSVYLLHKNKIRVVLPDSGKSFHFSFVVHRSFYVLEVGSGIKKLEKGKLNLIPGGDFFAAEKVYAMLPLQNGHILIATREHGLFDLDGSGKIAPFKTEADEPIKQAKLYSGILLHNGNIVLGSLSNGVFVLDQKGKLQMHLNRKNGLQDSFITDLFEDKQKGLWVTCHNGISRIEIAAPLRVIGENQGLIGQVKQVLPTDSYLYALTDQGAFSAKKEEQGWSQFAAIPGCSRLGFQLDAIVVNGKNKVFACMDDGLFELEGTRAQKIFDSKARSMMFLEHPNRILLGTENGIYELLQKGNTWKESPSYSEIGDDIRSIQQDKDGNIWLSTFVSGILALVKPEHAVQFSKVKGGPEKYPGYYLFRFGTQEGLPDLKGNHILNTDSGTVFLTFQGFMKFNFKKGCFQKFRMFHERVFDGNYQVYKYVKTGINEYWLALADQDRGYVFHIKGNKSESFERLKNYYALDIRCDASGLIYFAVDEGLLIYNPGLPFNGRVPYACYLTTIKNIRSGETLWMPNSESGKMYQWNYAENNLSFSFSAPFYDSHTSTEYSWKLLGEDEKWTDFGVMNFCSYSNLHEGNYTLLIRARNIYGDISSTASFSFGILPPWYRTWMAYLLYGCFFVVLFATVLRLNTRRLVAAKNRLEQTVKERTHEIVVQKEEIQKQKQLVELKNKDILDSINYAKRIQEAILPVSHEIEQFFEDAFIFFQPRDIVSGDFYWFYKTSEEECIFAVADCTGHGVPGAFMSMIGHTLLNEIVIEKKIHTPGKILSALHLAVRHALKQHLASDSRDGMDIAICLVNRSTKQLVFAGANRPLIVQSAENFYELKPDKKPIGGMNLSEAEEERRFTDQDFELSGNEWVYLFSDGLADQFGGEQQKKYKLSRLKQQLSVCQAMAGKEQLAFWEKEMKEWKGELEQIDDILLAGFRI